MHASPQWTFVGAVKPSRAVTSARARARVMLSAKKHLVLALALALALAEVTARL